jgi:AraC-like DNA-binding protein
MAVTVSFDAAPVSRIDSSPHAARMRAVEAYLRVHSAEAVSLTRLAEVAGLSSFYFIRVFRAAFGVTPHTYLTRLRLERARMLLRTAMPIAQAAVAAGFSDQSHLTRLFKRVYGTTPGVYARAVRS